MPDIKAQPFAFPARPDQLALIVIDMQRDFAEPGGFGASLGNDVSRITRIVPDVKRLIQGFRNAGLPVIHTMECHRPDLSDLPPAKRDRGNPTLRIGDELICLLRNIFFIGNSVSEKVIGHNAELD